MSNAAGSDKEYLGSGASGGVVLGRTAADLVALHNATPCTQQFGSLTTTTLATLTTTQLSGLTTTEVAAYNTAFVKLNTIAAGLLAKGI